MMWLKLITVIMLTSPLSDVQARFELRQGQMQEYFSRKSSATSVKKFYKLVNFQFVWLYKNSPNDVCNDAIKLMENAHEEGLNSDSYKAAQQAIDSLDGSIEKLIQAEVTITETVLQYISDVKNGRAPQSLISPDSVAVNNIDVVEFLSSGILHKSNWMDEVSVAHAGYQSLKKSLQKYQSIIEKQLWASEKIILNKPLKLNDTHPQIQQIKRTLQLLGYHFQNMDSELFDHELSNQIRLFQLNHKINIDGVLGSQTLEYITLSPQERMRQIIINMEKWRWFDQKLAPRHIIINIPGFDLHFFENHKKVLYSPVIVGSLARKTPVFKTSIKAITFNPTWNVPRSIATTDLLAKFQANPQYFVQNEFYATDSYGQHFDTDNINWGSYHKNYFPLNIKQRPGEKNALGKMKIETANSNGIYLHSTPHKELFDKNTRFFSSGCVRVQKILELASVLFNDQHNWNLDKINGLVATNTTKTIKISQDVPVYFSYFTVGYDNFGNEIFFPDIYGIDKKIENALFKAMKKTKF